MSILDRHRGPHCQQHRHDNGPFLFSLPFISTLQSIHLSNYSVYFLVQSLALSSLLPNSLKRCFAVFKVSLLIRWSIVLKCHLQVATDCKYLEFLCFELVITNGMDRCSRFFLKWHSNVVNYIFFKYQYWNVELQIYVDKKEMLFTELPSFA